MKNRLNELRTERKLLQEDLAKQINFSQQIISRYESGKQLKINPNFEDAVCNFFGCTLDYLRYRSNVRNEAKYSETLKKVATLIEEFYSEDSQEKKQDLSDDELTFFLEWITAFKSITQNTPKMKLQSKSSVNHFDKL